ncbi:MAG TPA: hypothetical protein VKE22_19895 [Haliangiales bacterium]|nr:hypothetical protein [Haliangiales bacterium]
MAPPVVSLPSLGIAGLALAVAAAFLVAVRRVAPERLPRAAVGVAAWMALWLAAAAAGVLARFDLRPPPFAVLFVATIAIALALGRSRLGGRLARGLPLAALVGFHAFRLPLELLLYRAAVEGVMPVQMSFSGWNFDIVTGATALVLLPVADRVPRAVVAAWNLLGLALLATIVAIAVASTPLFGAFGPDRLNTFVAYPPYVWLPAVLVAAALVGHIVILRRLAQRDGATITA